jgi:hypothetical protein
VDGLCAKCLIVTYLFSANEFDRHGWLHNKIEKRKVSVGLLSIAKLDKICLLA